MGGDRMSWSWKNESSPESGSDGQRCATRTVVRSQCRTEEVEPGKFIRKCQTTQEILRDCIGSPVEVVQSNREYTEEDVTDQVLKGSVQTELSDRGPLGFSGLQSDVEAIEKMLQFPGLRRDVEALERSLSTGLQRFFEAAEDLKNGFFGDYAQQEEVSQRPSKTKPESGHVDLSDLARDV